MPVQFKDGRQPKIKFETCESCGDAYVRVYLTQVDCQYCQPIRVKPQALQKRPPYNTKDIWLDPRPEHIERVDRAIRYGLPLFLNRPGAYHGQR